MSSTSLISLTNRQLDTIKRTIATDTNDEEFELFVEVCKRTGLDPFLKHVFPLVFSKNEPLKRRMSIVVAQAGLRLLADRTHDYRPDETEPVYTYTDDFLARAEEIAKCRMIDDLDARKARIQKINEVYPIDPANPAGILKVNVTLYKMDTRGVWHPVSGVAHWIEFAPVSAQAAEYEWVDTGEVWPDTGKKKMKKKPIGPITMALDTGGNWPKMPKLMIAKCATMQALRAGWPSVYGGLYDEAEMDRARVADRSATEAIEEYRAEQRAAIIGAAKDEYPTISDDGNLVFVTAGRFVDHFLALARTHKLQEQHDSMLSRNREALARFWTHHKDDALQLKTELEKIRSTLEQTVFRVPLSPRQVEIPLPDPVTTEPAPVDSKTRFINAQYEQIALFTNEADLGIWFNSTERAKAIEDFELTDKEKADIRAAAVAQKAKIRK